MGKRGQRRPNKKSEATESDLDPVDATADALASMFRPIPQNMRNELNGVVEKLLMLVKIIFSCQFFIVTMSQFSHDRCVCKFNALR
jgi:hypothetical protein